METFERLSEQQLNDVLSKIGKTKIGLIGDLCIDIYWKADITRSELSRETPHFPLPIVEERMSPGGGGNAVVNIAALRPAQVEAIGVIGNDWRGKLLLSELQNRGIGDAGLVVSDQLITNAYCKPIRMGISDVEYEDPRLDFCNYKPLPAANEKALLEKLDKAVKQLDVLCVSDQFIYGCITSTVRQQIIRYATEGLAVIVDSRNRIGEYHSVIMKPNEIEAWKVVQDSNLPPNDQLDTYAETVERLTQINGAPVCMTIGSNGCLYADERGTTHIASYPVKPPVDIVGAGDTFLAAFGLALGAKINPIIAASFGNLASSITVRKIGTTGTASPEEMREELSALKLN
ncbi:MAG: PfkB family carbohydrate kinase [Tannerellaceae bacterium]|jgi:rfaE bifunctional protein kinase chain/domain|nr:PfkB family carbohydrate kinase [Tannerellaceae bacterium]